MKGKLKLRIYPPSKLLDSLNFISGFLGYPGLQIVPKFSSELIHEPVSCLMDTTYCCLPSSLFIKICWADVDNFSVNDIQVFLSCLLKTLLWQVSGTGRDSQILSSVIRLEMSQGILCRRNLFFLSVPLPVTSVCDPWTCRNIPFRIAEPLLSYPVS